MIQTYMNEEIFEKLEMSKTEVTELTLRDLRCPNCRFLIDKIYSDIQGHMQVKCPKCKNAGACKTKCQAKGQHQDRN